MRGGVSTDRSASEQLPTVERAVRNSATRDPLLEQSFFNGVQGNSRRFTVSLARGWYDAALPYFHAEKTTHRLALLYEFEAELQKACDSNRFSRVNRLLQSFGPELPPLFFEQSIATTAATLVRNRRVGVAADLLIQYPISDKLTNAVWQVGLIRAVIDGDLYQINHCFSNLPVDRRNQVLDTAIEQLLTGPSAQNVYNLLVWSRKHPLPQSCIELIIDSLKDNNHLTRGMANVLGEIAKFSSQVPLQLPPNEHPWTLEQKKIDGSKADSAGRKRTRRAKERKHHDLSRNVSRSDQNRFQRETEDELNRALNPEKEWLQMVDELSCLIQCSFPEESQQYRSPPKEAHLRESFQVSVTAYRNVQTDLQISKSERAFAAAAAIRYIDDFIDDVLWPEIGNYPATEITSRFERFLDEALRIVREFDPTMPASIVELPKLELYLRLNPDQQTFNDNVRQLILRKSLDMEYVRRLALGDRFDTDELQQEDYFRVALSDYARDFNEECLGVSTDFDLFRHLYENNLAPSVLHDIYLSALDGVSPDLAYQVRVGNWFDLNKDNVADYQASDPKFAVLAYQVLKVLSGDNWPPVLVK